MREAALEQVLGDDSVLEALGLAARLGHEGRAELEIQGVAAQRVRIVRPCTGALSGHRYRAAVRAAG